MSDDEVDQELLVLLRQSMLDPSGDHGRDCQGTIEENQVLQDAEFIYNNATNVAIDMQSTKAAAVQIYAAMQKRQYSTESWTTENELHPKTKDEAAVEFIFLMDLLNFSFWSSECAKAPFTVDFRGKQWTGYWSLVAAIHRAQESGIPITDPAYWVNEDQSTHDAFAHIFRSSTDSPIPLLPERISCLRQAGAFLIKV